MAQLFCPKCNKTMGDINFYQYKNGEKCELCKNCLTLHVNNFEPDTFLWILEKFDVPYVEEEWNVLRDREFAKNPYKMKGTTVIGRYLAKMRLKKWKDFGWADTERIKAENEEKAKLYGQPKEQVEQKLKEMEEAYHNGEISEAQWLTFKEIESPAAGQLSSPYDQEKGSVPSPYPVNDHPFETVELPEVEITEEEKMFYAVKWGRLYSAEDWLWLEKKYEDFMKSFDIQGAARIDTLIMICKTSLKMNQALDSGDIDSYQKLSRVYDAMMKAAKFTEAQRKEEKSGEFDSVGQIVFFAEKHGGAIERYKTDIPLDIYDESLQKLKDYTRELIMSDTALAQQIETYIQTRKNLELEKQMKKETKDGVYTVKDEDYKEFNKLKEKEEEDIEEEWDNEV